MPAKSKQQQKFFGLVRAYQKGEIKAKDLPEDIREKIINTAKNMSNQDVKDYAKTKHKNLPKKANLTHLEKIFLINKKTTE